MINTKHKIMLVLSLLILTVSVIVTGYNLYHEHEENKRRLSEAYGAVHRTYNETIKDTLEFYHSRAEANLRSPGVIQAFRDRDHDKLHELVAPRWGVMQRENSSLSVMQFHNADGTSLLRVHQPRVYGDRIADHRPMVAHAHKTQQNVHGFEEGRQGLAYRIMIPAFDKGEYIGAVEFGITPPHFTNKIRRFAGYDSFFFVRKSAIGTFGRIERSIEVGNYLGLDIPQRYQPMIQKYADFHTKVENDTIVYLNQTYEVNVLNINNYKGQAVGAIMFIRPTSDFKTHVRHMIIASFIIIFVLIVIIGLLVDRIYTYVVQKMSFEERYSQMILDAVPSAVIVTDGESLVAANSSFLGYLNYKNVESFKQEHACVCEYFEEGDTDEYLMPMRNDKRWTEYMLDHPLKTHKAKMTLDGITTIFEVRISVLKMNDKSRYVVIFNDISTMQMQTMTDPLTQIPNRLHFTMVYEHAINIAQRGREPLGVVFFDIDHFKDVNDRFGHLVGDVVLKEIAAIVRQRIRRSDIVARWGGEEFVLLLPQTDFDEAIKVAQMLRSVIDQHSFEGVGNVTCSFGVAILEEDENGDELLNRADALLYEAKASGRNRVVS
jgi:diguanylate cyclase (GGDEF)-like protein